MWWFGRVVMRVGACRFDSLFLRRIVQLVVCGLLGVCAPAVTQTDDYITQNDQQQLKLPARAVVLLKSRPAQSAILQQC